MIYFDNSATTRVSLKAAEKAYYIMRECYANPSSLHTFGFLAEKEFIAARKQVAKAMNVLEEEIFFTSGGTEANNLAVFGTAEAYKRRGKHIITTRIEHPSVAKVVDRLKENGYEVSFIDVNKNGYIDIEQLESEIRKETILISVIFVNNEIGTVQNIDEIYNIVKKKNEKALIHLDCVQGFCKHKINCKKFDLVSVSGHKIHAPKGVGALYIKKGVKITPIITGGLQQNAIRPGTENLSAVAAFGVACEAAFSNINENFDYVKKIKEKLKSVVNIIPDVYINGDSENGSPYILNLSFKDVRGEVLLHTLEEREIYVSTGSACSSRQKKRSGTVEMLGTKMAENSVRFSFSDENTVEEADECVRVLSEVIPILRKFKAR